MEYLKSKDLVKCLRDLKIRGGKGQAIASKVLTVLGNLAVDSASPLEGLKVTNHGETRIKHCVKFDLGDGYRLITVQNDKYVLFCYVGDHDDCDRWLERNKGLTLLKSGDGQFTSVRKTEKIGDPSARISGESDGTEKRLLERLKERQVNFLLDGLSPFIVMKLYELDNVSDEGKILSACDMIPDKAKASFVYDVLTFLKEGDLDQAKTRIELYKGEAAEIEQLTEREFIEIQDGDSIRRIDIESREYLDWIKGFIDSSTYQDWMLFMHPVQKKMVDMEFAGSAKLSGVSGSGKTCIIVNRAIRLARKKPTMPVLILTLNKSLSALIDELVDHACGEKETRELIQVKSFFGLCQEYLLKFEPENKKLYNDVTWRSNDFVSEEHIDEVWREFYRCELNVDDASVLFPIHKSLNTQNIFPEEYLRQEFDWVRSAFAQDERRKYLGVERKGRAVPLPKPWRELILDGLPGWERKMNWVGVIDYLGLATCLARHLDKVKPEFSSVLVDEAQDFGTMELKIIRNLVEEGENDIFLCGDMAQHVLPKHNSFKDAGIDIPGARSHTILKNYRNSREILGAAYELLVKNLDGDVIMDSELEVMDPEYANFSTPKPHVLSADSLEEEIAFALGYMASRFDGDEGIHKGCIAIAGFSLLETQKFARRFDLPVLDGSRGLQHSGLFFSDLEQTKGYEFNTMCILNCRHRVLPPIDMPPGEQYRDACRLYVAMTRAKRDLILSFSGELSTWIDKCRAFFEFDRWEEYIEKNSLSLRGMPEKASYLNEHAQYVLGLSGRKFLYTRHALGLSLELQEKIDELVDGIGRSRDGQAVAWRNIRSAYEDVLNRPRPKQLFGLKTYKDFIEKIDQISSTGQST